MWQSVGTWMPARFRAVSSISPGWASTVRLFTSIVVTSNAPYSVTTALNRQTSTQVPQPMHLSGMM